MNSSNNIYFEADRTYIAYKAPVFFMCCANILLNIFFIFLTHEHGLFFDYPKILAISGTLMSASLLLNSILYRDTSIFNRIYLLFSLTYFFPYQFGILLLLNQNLIFLHFLFLFAMSVFVLITNVLFVAPILIVGLLLAYITQSYLAVSAIINENVSVTFFSCLIVVFFISLIASKRKRDHERQVHDLQVIAYSIAHELRTPLSAIIQGSKYIKRQSNDSDHVLQSTIDGVSSTAIQALTSIDMLLNNIKKVKDCNLVAINMNDAIPEIIAEYPLQEAQRKLINICINDFYIRSDYTLIKYLLFNLLKNALFQIKKHGKGEIFIYQQSSKKYNILSFKDTAAGIPSEKSEHIFDLFYTDGGSGIGLAFCKSVMKTFGGYIHCNSKEGEYAEFNLFFPKLDNNNNKKNDTVLLPSNTNRISR